MSEFLLPISRQFMCSRSARKLKHVIVSRMFEPITVLSEEYLRGNERYTLVAIMKRVIVDQRMEECRSLVINTWIGIFLTNRLTRPCCCRFEQSLIFHARRRDRVF